MLEQRSLQRERLDEREHDERDLARTLRHMDGANRWLGGYRSVIRHLVPLLQTGLNVLLDVGTGSADLPRRLVSAADRRGFRLEVVAVDAQREIARQARARGRATDGVHVTVSDGLQLPVRTNGVDIAVATLVLHHFTDDAAINLVAELARVARRAVIVSDLERHFINYWGARVIAGTVWRRSPYAQDGPISVLRSFRRHELQAIGERAGLRGVAVCRHFPYRLALVGTP